MKNIKIIFVISVVYFFCLSASNAQYIKAGIHTSTDIYTDVIPDDSVWEGYANCCYSEYDSLNIDIDHNNVYDFKFVKEFVSAGGGWLRYYINSLDTNNALIFSQPDTCIVWPGATKVYQACVPLNYGDSISSNLFFHNYRSYLHADGYGGFVFPTINSWDGIRDHYIGFLLYVPRDTLYGWIGVDVSSSGKVTVKDYACNRFPACTIENIYPNPANESVIIKTEGVTGDFQLYSIQGKLVRDVPVINGQIECTIETVSLAEGCYILSANYHGAIVSKRIIIKH